MSNIIDYTQIPPVMMESLERYVKEGIPPGGFLTAILENDLMKACGRADETNIRLIPVYAAWLYNRAPSNCHGSPGNVAAWVNSFNEEAV